MKKLLALIVTLVLLGSCCGAMAEGVMAGGWSVAETTELDADTLALFEKAFENWTGSLVEPLALLGLQVVNGTNYCFLAKVTPVVPDAMSHLCLVYIWEGMDGTVEMTSMQDIELGIAE